MYMPCLLPIYVTEQIAKHNNFTTQIVSNINKRTPKEYKKFVKNQIDINFTYPVHITTEQFVQRINTDFEKACHFAYICYRELLSKDIFFEIIKDYSFNKLEQQAIDLFKQDIILEEDLLNINCSLEVKIRLATLLGFFYEIDNEHFDSLFLWGEENLDVFYFLSIKEFYRDIIFQFDYRNLNKYTPLACLTPKVYFQFLDDCNAYAGLLKFKGEINGEVMYE